MSAPIESLLPHRPPMRWIDELVACSDTAATATVCFGAGHVAVADGAVLEPALVECVAQTVAAAQGERARRSGQPGGGAIGMLAAVSNFRIESRPPAEKQLRVEVRELRRFGAMLLVSGEVWCDGRRIASGELTLHG